MKQKFASENTTFAVLMGLLAILLLVPSCTTEDEALELILSQNIIKPQTTDNQVQITI